MHDIEYLLKYLLDSTTLKILKLEDISSTTQTATFSKKYNDVKRIRGFCQSVQDTTKIPIFNVPLTEGSITHTVIFCEAAVGESIYVSKEYSKQMNVPGHYDSFIINEKEYKTNIVDTPNLDIGEYSYVIKDSSKILPLFEVTFEYDAEVELRSKGCFICERCKKNQSTSFCPAERASFCEQCDTEVHSDSFLKRHVRYYFNEVGKKKFIYCLNHSDTLVDYFCEECLVPVCTRCKISGNHSELPYGSHQLTDYVEACDKLKSILSESNESLTETEKQISFKINDFKKNITNFQENVKILREKIETEYRTVLNELQVHEKKEYQIINTAYINYLSQMTEIIRMKEYPSGLEPSQLMKTFKNVMMQRNTVEINNSDVYRPTEVFLKGHLTLRDEEMLSARTGYPSRMNKSTQLYVETRGVNVSQTDDIKNI